MIFQYIAYLKNMLLYWVLFESEAHFVTEKRRDIPVYYLIHRDSLMFSPALLKYVIGSDFISFTGYNPGSALFCSL